MKILIALSRFPLPIDKGDKLRAYYQIKELSRKNELYLVCLITRQPSEEDMEHLKKYCKEVVLVKLSFLRSCLNLFFSFFNSFPFQVNYFESVSMKKKIYEIIISKQIDICYVQLIRLVNNIPFGLKTKYYIDFMDALSVGMNNRYHFSNWYEKIFVGMEARRLQKFEKKIFSYFNGGSIITDADAEAFPSFISEKLAVISNGVDEKYFGVGRFEVKKFDLIFTGNMAYHPNVIACKYLVKEILPILKKKFPDFKICLAGTDPTAEVLGLASDNTVVTGYVNDIKDYLSQAKLFVAPLFSGSGLQNKLLESMASGLPALTTPIANKALGAENGKEIIVCKDELEFSEQIIFLLENPGKAKELGMNGQRYIKGRYNWKDYNQLLENEFMRIIKE
jgi:glycosyltransferase involved in cell wall biosynthesis